jgi:regulator of sirC expression with transglutaminase-like and TPR domain
MGQILLEKGNYPEASTHLQSYLKLMPNASNADAVKQLIQKLQGGNALTKVAPAAQQPQQ